MQHFATECNTVQGPTRTRVRAWVLSDGVDHIWESYAGTFNANLSSNQAKEWLTALGGRLHLVYGDADRTRPPEAAIRTLGNRSGARINVIERGDHHLPIRQGEVMRRVSEIRSGRAPVAAFDANRNQ